MFFRFLYFVSVNCVPKNIELDQFYLTNSKKYFHILLNELYLGILYFKPNFIYQKILFSAQNERKDRRSPFKI